MANNLIAFDGPMQGIPIVVVRGEPVVLANDIARLFGMSTAAFNQQVKRNLERFVGDWCFLLSEEEFAALKSQNVISSGWGGVRHPPWAFTEHGLLLPRIE